MSEIYDGRSHYGAEDDCGLCICGADHSEDRGICACGGDGIWISDPYASEIGGVESYSFMCDSCEHDSLMDI